MRLDKLRTWSRGCLTMQGYGALADGERRQLWLGIRLAPALCLLGIAVGTVLASPAVLFLMAGLAAVGGFLAPKHPFDYLYDVALRPIFGGPAIPVSPAPRRFACQLATPWIAAIAFAFLADASTVAWILAAPLIVVAATVTTTNWCLPSLIYGLVHGRQPSAAS